MKKLQFALVVTMLVVGSGVATAQDAQPQGQRQGGRGNMIPMLLQGITLTVEQQAKVDTLVRKFGEQRQAMMQELQGAEPDARRAKMREASAKQQEEVKALLTDEQKKVFEKNIADMQARMQGGGGRPPR